ncbi:carbohydrate kinase family protein [Streptomyces cadmiisoli]|uniref:Carbohydrate kinase family protein n=1 Tax=Streptomyces cadmiisoli TaxID=2184053 RepID=A0A2Z4ITY0_9ACTN|nr:carbohydrate kinase family protein [Streptomyces cadmiisoli]AWW35996.1 carbohydrate kinase family protein [Streptomyces cadmiisoli]
MRIAVTGSIATDHLMTFQGRFADLLSAGRAGRVALSYEVHSLDVRRGGVAANIAFGLARLGLRPLLVGAVGNDFADYRSWLERHGVDTSGVRESRTRHTARSMSTTDADQNKIASFYAGAMAEAREIELASFRGIDLVVVSPNDPEAMLRHTAECRARGIRFAADPSQQLVRLDGPRVRALIDGAAYLFGNAYERGLCAQKTGWSDAQILGRVGVRVTTLGSAGVVLDRAGSGPLRVPAVRADTAVDPTGAGDAFRAGFLAATAWGLGLERAAQVGGLVAVHAVETVGGQGYVWRRHSFLTRMRQSYGDGAAAEVAACLEP